MNMIDNDLLSIQEARILAENAAGAFKEFSKLSQKQLNKIVEGMFDAVIPHLAELAVLSVEETGYGKIEDKIAKNNFVCTSVRKQIRDMKCVGLLESSGDPYTMKVGVPLGVIAALVPSTSPVSTTVFQTVIAVKAGNAIIVSPHQRAKKTISRTMDLLIDGARKQGMPEGVISYLHTVEKSGTQTLIRHPEVRLVLNNVAPRFSEEICGAGKAQIYSGGGNGPVFIERTADIRQAVHDIIESKTFDCGVVTAAEQSIVVEQCIESEVRKELVRQGAYFMSCEEAERLGKLLYHTNGKMNAEFIGLSAKRLAARAGFEVAEDIRMLIAEGSYALSDSPYNRENLCPVLSYYIEDDWQGACEKCIELLFYRQNAHTLVIHSKDQYVIQQFSLKKPVARVLVNTPATLGSMGVTTTLFPSMMLGSGMIGQGVTSENVSPMNLIYIRTIGFGMRNSDSIRKNCEQQLCELRREQKQKKEKGIQVLRGLLDEALS